MAVTLSTTGVTFPDASIQTTAAGASAMVYISTVTVTNNNNIDVTWTGTENALYDMMVIQIVGLYPDTLNRRLRARFFIGGSLNSSSEYSYVCQTSTTNFDVVVDTSGTSAFMNMSANQLSNVAANAQSWTIYIPYPGNSAQYPNMYYFGTPNKLNAGPFIGSGQNSVTTGTTTGVRFFTDATNFTAATFRLYGIKKS